MTSEDTKDERTVRGRAGEHAASAVATDQRTVWTGPDPHAMHGAVAIGAIVGVPQIRAAWEQHVVWTPVRGAGHHDIEVFDFEAWHWHVDLRFADTELYDLIGAAATREHTDRDIITLIADRVRPVTKKGKRLRADRQWRYYAPTPRERARCYTRGHYLADHHAQSWQRVTPMQCLRAEQPKYEERWCEEWQALQRHYASASWGRARRCPHRGANLNGIEADANAMVRCPLHGLVFDCTAGRATTVEAVMHTQEAHGG